MNNDQDEKLQINTNLKDLTKEDLGYLARIIGEFMATQKQRKIDLAN